LAGFYTIQRWFCSGLLFLGHPAHQLDSEQELFRPRHALHNPTLHSQMQHTNNSVELTENV